MYLQVHQSVDSRKFPSPLPSPRPLSLPLPSPSVRSSVRATLEASFRSSRTQIDHFAKISEQAFRGWRAEVRRSREQWKSTVVLKAEIRARMTRGFFFLWREKFAEKKTREIMVDSLASDQAKLTNFRLRRKILHLWREDVADKKIAETSFALFQANRKKEIFSRLRMIFRETVLEQKQIALAEIFNEENRKVHFFAAWREVGVRKKCLENSAKKFQAHMALSRFLAVGTELVEKRNFMESFARPVIHRWRDISDQRRVVQGLVARVAVVRVKRLLRTALTAAISVHRLNLRALNFRAIRLFQKVITGFHERRRQISMVFGFCLWRLGARKLRDERMRSGLSEILGAWRSAT